MPHITVEYSTNLTKKFNIQSLLQDLHDWLAEEKINGAKAFDIKNIKTRAIPLEHCIVGTEDQPNEMIHITLKILPKAERDDEAKKKMAVGLHEVARDVVKEGHPQCAVSVEVVELHAPSYTS